MAGARHAAGGQPRIVPRPTELRGRGPLAKETDLILLPTASSSSPTAAAGGRERGGRTRRGRREGREGDSRRLRRTRGYSDTDDTSHRSDVVRVRSSPKDDTRAGLGAAPVRPLPGDLLVLQRVRQSRHESVPGGMEGKARMGGRREGRQSKPGGRAAQSAGGEGGRANRAGTCSYFGEASPKDRASPSAGGRRTVEESPKDELITSS